jgi:hypothetical protein
MSIFKRDDGTVSRGKVGSLGAALLSLFVMVIGVLRLLGVEVPWTDDAIQQVGGSVALVIDAIWATLISLGVFGVRAALD